MEKYSQNVENIDFNAAHWVPFFYAAVSLFYFLLCIIIIVIITNIQFRISRYYCNAPRSCSRGPSWRGIRNIFLFFFLRPSRGVLIDRIITVITSNVNGFPCESCVISTIFRMSCCRRRLEKKKRGKKKGHERPLVMQKYFVLRARGRRTVRDSAAFLFRAASSLAANSKRQQRRLVGNTRRLHGEHAKTKIHKQA